MGINFQPDNTPELATTSTSVWSPISDTTIYENNESYWLKFNMLARRADGVSAYWDAVYIFERTSNTNRVLTPNVLDVLSPVKDLAALGWDIRVVVSGTSCQIQCKGGSLSNPVAWYLRGELIGTTY